MNILIHSIRFLVFTALQVLIFNHLNFSNPYLFPQIYVLFLLFLPMETPTWLLITIGFVTGLLIDMSMHTYGIHAFSCSTLAFLRPGILNFLSPRDGYVFNSEPTISHQGVSWFMSYATVLIFVHHACLFLIEKYSWYHFLDSIIKILISTLFTLLIAVVFQLLFTSRKAKS